MVGAGENCVGSTFTESGFHVSLRFLFLAHLGFAEQ